MNSKNMEFWEKAVLHRSASLKDAVENLTATCLRISLVVDEAGLLVGTITDGDIRRALMNGKSLTADITHVMNHKPLVVPPNMSEGVVGRLMQANGILQIPIVDSSGILLGLHLSDNSMEVKKARESLMVIMAGGKGKRLRPHTESCPKPMLLVGDSPMLEHIIVRARNDGFVKFVLCLNYLGEMVREYFGDGRSLDVSIEYVNEDHPLGTAGALSLLQEIPGMPFLVSNGDVLSDISYSNVLNFHDIHSAEVTMAIKKHEYKNPFGVVNLDGISITGIEEKPVSESYVNAGIYVISPRVLGLLRRNEYCDMPDLVSRACQSGIRCVGYPMHEPWLDVGREEDLILANSNKRFISDVPL